MCGGASAPALLIRRDNAAIDSQTPAPLPVVNHHLHPLLTDSALSTSLKPEVARVQGQQLALLQPPSSCRLSRTQRPDGHLTS